MSTVIRVSNLGKEYVVGRTEAYGTLRDSLTRAVTAPFRRGQAQGQTETMWALRDVSFDIAHALRSRRQAVPKFAGAWARCSKSAPGSIPNSPDARTCS